MSPYEMRWYHGCNTLSKLQEALNADVEMVECDVTIGQLLTDGREQVMFDLSEKLG